ncbi:MAG: SDR family oxidoreductase [Alphaproteobacteria bacterium]|nr:SDR family oxidoreductase [Alphaproteobacteria bacterium]
MVAALDESGMFTRVLGLTRGGEAPLDLNDERSIAAAARQVAETGLPLRLMFAATGFLHDGEMQPERSLRDVSPAHMAKAFAVNAIGPALLLKHFLPLLPRTSKAVFAVLSAKVGSIGDNRLGGWHSYRASKAALNQIVRTASIELARTRPDAICVALHPGTVDTPLSAPFAKRGLALRAPDDAARQIVGVIAGLTPRNNGAFLGYRGSELPW